MKFTINREQFLKGLTIASKAIGSKSPIPVMVNVKLTLDEKGLNIIGSNNELSIKTIVPYMIGETTIIRASREGSTLVASRIITEIVRRIEGTELSFEVFDGTIVQIEDGRSNFKLNSVKPEEYPEIDLEPTGTKIELNAKEFIKMVEQTAFAASQKEQRPILTAVNIEAVDGKLVATATDSARLAKKEIVLAASSHFSVNIPAKVLSEISKLLENEPALEMVVSDKKALFLFDGTIVSSRLISGEYPNTRNIVPRAYNYKLEVNAAEILRAMERVSLLSGERENVVKLLMSDNGVEVSSKSAQTGSAVESITTCQFAGERLEISFNAEYVGAAIRACQSEDVTLGFVGEMKPFSVRDAKDDSQIQIVTPVRTY